MKSTFALLTLLISASQTWAAQTVVHLGLASNFSEASSSSSNPYGDYFRNGAQLALKDAEPLLQKRAIQIALDEFDYGTDSVRVLNSAKNAVASPVIGVLGYNFSSHALLAAPIHQQNHLPMLTPSATADRVGQMGAYVHTECFSNRFMGQTLAHLAADKLKAHRAAVVYAADCAYCQDLARAFTEEFQKKGGEIAVSLSVLEADHDYSAVMEKLKAANFDVVLVPNQELSSARIISAALRAGIHKPFLGGDGWGTVGDEFFGTLAGQTLTGYSVSHWHPDLHTARSDAFLKRYEKAFHKKPNDTSVLAYDSMTLLITAVLQSKTLTRQGLEEAFENIRRFDGITGHAIFKTGQAPEKTLVVLEANSSHFKIVGSVEPILKEGKSL
jgi:branched-chain amino acid transport system substrate-binding protein